MSNQANDLSDEQGRALLRLARSTLSIKLQGEAADGGDEATDRRLADPGMQRHCGTFVTLKIGGQLRGCIGTLVGNEPLVEGVRRNALQAAFHDPRFPPLKRDELAQVAIEVSVLTEPHPLSYVDADDLIAKLRPHVDGVTLRKGISRATFLPQVWEQLPRPDAFLTHLCLKAGLSGDAWRKGDLEIETYQVRSFEEDPA